MQVKNEIFKKVNKIFFFKLKKLSTICVINNIIRHVLANPEDLGETLSRKISEERKSP